ncbi:hypothetical protein B0O80DRAFT_281063 [Mortierella sp. GBAus27b]|nr:hypothetical protein B0O80DRAFT_281063 [Mortierella sp. GBAus27b]
MANINPLDMPEIRSHVGQFLEHADLVCCLQVCQAWRSTYLPLVWSKMSLRQGALNPTMESLSLHRELVKDLYVLSELGAGFECVSIEFPNLKRLEVHSKFGIQLWKFPCDLSNLQHLTVGRLTLETADTTTFWNLCTQLESLRADKLVVTHLPKKSIAFGRLAKLSLSLRTDMIRALATEWIEWISQCRNIVALHLYYYCGISSLTHDFSMSFATGTWPKMQELRLQYFRFSDGQLAKVIEGIHKATVLSVNFSVFGELSLTALRHHYPYLRYLQVRKCHYLLGSQVVAEVMASCPQLEHLSAGHSRDTILNRRLQ